MSDIVDLSRVTALSHKGCELALKGHDARAAEKFRLAAEEAEKTLILPDCLVTSVLRDRQLDSLLNHATTSAVKPADADDALREAFSNLLPSAVAVLERRKAAGTLLHGCCRPVEEAYHLALKRHSLELQGCTQARAAENAAELAPYVGVETYISAASSVAFMVNNMDNLKRVFVLSEERMDAAYLFLASAVDLMTLPRDHEPLLTGEPELVRYLRRLIPMVSDLDKPETTKLVAAWQCLQRSGVLQERGIDAGIDAALEIDARLRAVAAADFAAGRLQQCALAGCEARESHASHFKKCGACRTVAYCCREHQVEDWPSHKAACKAARKAAADVGASGA